MMIKEIERPVGLKKRNDVGWWKIKEKGMEGRSMVQCGVMMK